MDNKTVKEQLLNLPDIEIKERRLVRKDYYFYKGRCSDKEKAKSNKDLLGQNWEVNDNVDYEPTQEIRNKVKPLLKKQARFMFGKEPTIILKPDDNSHKEKCEELRKFIDDVFEDNKFWKKTRKAFLNSTIKKRVLLRVEANPKIPIVIKYEDIENFYYKEINDKLVDVSFFEEDLGNIYKKDDKDKIYYIHRYYYKQLEENKEISVWYMKKFYSGSDLNNPKEIIDKDTGFSIMPCWLIKNGGELNEEFGESDIDDIRDTQNQYNRRISDFADALRFQMFGSTTIIDGDPNTVNDLTIAPGGLQAIKTEKEVLEIGKQAVIQKQEYNFGSSEAVNSYLDRAARDMNIALDMPDIKDLVNIPSAKAMKYLYNDLIARCEEKWSDWEPILKDLISFIIEASKSCYCGCFKDEWRGLDYTIIFKHNYPLPSDEEESKKIALEEVKEKVKSRKTYIKEYSDEEDSEKVFNEIIEETSKLNEAETNDVFSRRVEEELDDSAEGE